MPWHGQSQRTYPPFCTVPGGQRQDEAGYLIQAFRVMVTQLDYYFNEVLAATIDRRKYELRILQAQINSHFLCNSLSLINSRAIMTGQSEISQMALHLSAFYRTMLSKGKAVTTVQEELKNTWPCISIQLYCGGEYGLRDRSTPGFGICATLRSAKKLETA